MPSRKRSYDQYIDEVSLSEIQRPRIINNNPSSSSTEAQPTRTSRPRVRQQSVARRVQAVLEIFEGQLSQEFVKEFNRKSVVCPQKKTRKAAASPPPSPTLPPTTAFPPTPRKVPPTPRKRIIKKSTPRPMDYSASKILQALPRDAFTRQPTPQQDANKSSVISSITALVFMGMTTWWAFSR
ncbi:hypothetical protein L228DRAFT_50080 [Xylona heveae TC161]|uniref:Uncharacterized protein n=1 Tax=Xylona heveae (strain CBS 132557 / TC161) TaxID=1328760 RepID=A0A164ZMP3_XYLHT|nr:hypothetical protein L228DRAFT_50080 [Xylona heveae TC161]KZF19286.1 hypothetical protein L228DRAFT_50080 [Xylona heveae TC161]